MKPILLLFLMLTGSTVLRAQEGEWDWWNNLHGWEPGMKGWRMWLIISPGYLGPNALPVPEIKKGVNPVKSEFEFGSESHFKKGDPTYDIFSRLYIPFAHQKIAFEAYGVIIERYAMSEYIRNQRFARDRDGKGWTQGDLYLSTMIQLSRNRKFPNTLFRMTTKTASGGMYEAARYTDSPGYFFDFSFSKPLSLKKPWKLTPYSSFGFYSWQTNDEDNLQNDAFLYGTGIDYKNKTWDASACFSGYLGYKKQRDDPMVLTFDAKKDTGNKSLRVQIVKGLKSWDYTTVRFSAIWYFNGID